MEISYRRKLLVIGVLFLFLGASATVGVSANPAWADNFDSYTNNQFLDGTPDDGGWAGWGAAPAAGAYVRDDYARSYPHSVEIAGPSDLIHFYPGYTTGVWVYTAWQYIPIDFDGDSYLIMLDQYDGGGSGTSWSIQLSFNSATGLIQSQWTNEEMPYVTGAWKEIRCVIDLDTDWLEIYYDGTLLAQHAWTDSVQGDGSGSLNISTVDLFANGASPVYYDDISLEPYTTALTCDAGGAYVTELGDATNFSSAAHGGTAPYTYLWDFGDGNTSTEQNPSFTYGAVGLYDVTLTVTDGATNTAEDVTTVNVTGYVPPPPEPVLNINEIKGGLGSISAVVNNSGGAAASSVDWSIEVTGGILKRINKTYTGEIASLAAGAEQTIKTTGFIFGLGAIAITVTASCAEGSSDEATAAGKVLIIFIKI